VKRGPLLTDKAVVEAGDPLVVVPSFSSHLLFATTLSFLSSRAKPRDLRFYGPFLDMCFRADG
jgi:hypothetical protein